MSHIFLCIKTENIWLFKHRSYKTNVSENDTALDTENYCNLLLLFRLCFFCSPHFLLFACESYNPWLCLRRAKFMFLVVYYYYSVAREKVLFHYYFPSTYPMMDRFTAPNFLIKMLKQIFVRFCDDFAFGWKFVAFLKDSVSLEMLGRFG